MEISVIIPAFKPGDYLFDCLRSLDNQTIDKRLFEVIIVLNGTKEPYFNMISNFISNIEFNTRLYYTEITGVSNARNIALDIAKYNYIAFIDDDDIVSPTYLEGLLTLTGSDSIVISNSKTFKNDICQTGKNYITSAYEACRNRKSVSILRGRHFFSNGCGKLIPMSVIGKVRFDNKLALGEDSVFMVEISKNIKSVLIASEDVIYYIRKREGSASRSNIPFKLLFFTSIYEIRKYLTFCHWTMNKNNNIFIFSRIGATVKSFITFLFSKS